MNAIRAWMAKALAMIVVAPGAAMANLEKRFAAR